MEKTELVKLIANNGRKILEPFGIVLNEEQAPKVFERIMTIGLEQLILVTKQQAAEQGGEACIEFGKLLEVSITNRESDEGEKDGNQMISFTPGPQAKMLAKQDDATENEEE